MDTQAATAHFCQTASMQKIKERLCSKSLTRILMITSLIAAILGGLALIGMFYPTNPLGVLAGAFRAAGTYALLAGGLFLFAFVLVGRLISQNAECCKPIRKSVSDILNVDDILLETPPPENNNKPPENTNDEPPFIPKDTTGTGSVKGSCIRKDPTHNNVNF